MNPIYLRNRIGILPSAQSTAWILSLVAAASATAVSSSAIVGCSSAPEPAPPEGVEGTTSQAIGGIEGTFEYAIDAPWRMDPRFVNGVATYDPIPIQMTVHDADQIADDTEDLGGTPSIGDVCALVVIEGHTRMHVSASHFDEIERSRGDWKYPGTDQPTGPSRDECTRSGSRTCEGYARLTGTSEWHALATYATQAARPGADVPLTLEMRVTRNPAYACTDADSSHFYTLRNHVRVHYGEAQLPRFGPTWAYGDVHYHSQGTDNEGESGYNYRGVSRAMQAVGLDFTWATEHASDSEQIMDADVELGLDQHVQVRAKKGVLRDMDRRRFGAMSTIATNTNRAAALRNVSRAGTGALVTPQIWLGGEVDVIPETHTPYTGLIPYGDRKTYAVSTLCGGWQSHLKGLPLNECDDGVAGCYEVVLLDTTSCVQQQMTTPVNFGDSDILINDVQGINEYQHGREHMVYLPDPSAADPFVSSSTGKYGGARRRLVGDRYEGKSLPGMLPEVERKHGSLFLAHHLNAPMSTDSGPDAPPWSPSMLDKAWRSSAVLGLEFWNENVRLESSVAPPGTNPGQVASETGYERDATVLLGYEDLHLVDKGRRGLKVGSDGLFELIPFDLATGAYEKWTPEVEVTLTDGTVSWDKLNMRGLDMTQTASLPWLPQGEPRRMFMAGGSDAHGDFNYRRTGYLQGTDGITDARIGSPRNLVNVGLPSTSVDPSAPNVFGAAETLAALRAGHFAVTDGAALRIVVDTNRNGVIDASDPQMGDYVVLPSESTLPILVEYASTPEFGEIRLVELTVGALDTETGSRRIYEGGVGVRSEGAPATRSYTSGAWKYTLGARGYWRIDRVTTPTGEIANDPMLLAQYAETGNNFHGVQAFTIDLARLQLDNGHRPDRLFVRALASGHREAGADCSTYTTEDARVGRCIRRYAYTNPVWVNEGTPLPPIPGAPGPLPIVSDE